MTNSTIATHKGTILLVQNAQTQGNGTKRHLESTGYDVLWAGSGVSALMAAKRYAVDLILLDVALPDIEGTDLCRRFRERENTSEVPIILLTSRGYAPGPVDRRKGGPDDYLAKPYAESELDARIAFALRKRSSPAPPQAAKASPVSQHQPAASDGRMGIRQQPEQQRSPAARQEMERPSYPAAPAGQASRPGPSATAAPVREPQPGRFSESVTAAGAATGSTAAPFSSAAEDDEVIDADTGLFSRRQFEAMFSKEYKRSVRFKQQMSCMLIDLDGRKIGREGDAATLKSIVGLVQSTIREVDTAAWWSGEALIVLLPNTIRNDALQAAARILESVATHPFTWSDSTKVTMSIGVAGLPNRNITSEQKLIEAAAEACRRARDLMLP